MYYNLKEMCKISRIRGCMLKQMWINKEVLLRKSCFSLQIFGLFFLFSFLKILKVYCVFAISLMKWFFFIFSMVAALIACILFKTLGYYAVLGYSSLSLGFFLVSHNFPKLLFSRKFTSQILFIFYSNVYLIKYLVSASVDPCSVSCFHLQLHFYDIHIF